MLAVKPLSNGSASLATGALAIGPHSLTAVYAGDAVNAASTSATVLETINKLPTALQWASGYPAPNPLDFRQTLGVRGVLTGGVTQGTVSFRDGATVLGTASLACSGTCTAQLPAIANLTPGVHAITADYAGDGLFQPASVSAQVLVTNSAATGLIIQLLLDE